MSVRKHSSEEPDNHSHRNVLAMRFVLWLAIFLGLGVGLFAQAPLQVTLLSDLEEPSSLSIDSLISDELTALLSSRYDLNIATLYTGGQKAAITAAINRAYASADIVIGSGLATSSALMDRTVYPKPTIAAIAIKEGGGAGAHVVSSEAPPNKSQEEQGSGVENFTFVQSPFDLAKDLYALQSIVDYDQLVVITTESLLPTLREVIDKLEEQPVTYLLGKDSVSSILKQIPDGATAAYLSPLVENMPYARQAILLDSLTARGIATFGLIDQPMLELGMLAAYSSSAPVHRGQPFRPRRCSLRPLIPK